MLKNFTFPLFVFCLSLILPESSFAAESESTKVHIVALLQKWSKDFNAKNAPLVCSLFAPDLVAKYPDQKTRNHKEMCEHLAELLKDPDKTYHYDEPKIEQILVLGDTVVVNLIWTQHLKEKNKPDEKIVREHGFDIFKKQKDGTWKISVSYAIPESRKE